MALSRSVFVLATLAAAATPPPLLAGNDSAGHAIAEKFSGEAEAKANAKAEAARKAQELRREIARKVAAEARRKAEEVREAAEQARIKAEEQEMLARARREAEEREAATRVAREVEERLARERAAAEQAQRDADAAELKRREDERKAEADRQLREAAERQAAEERRRLELKTEEEARLLAEKHNRLRLEREARSERETHKPEAWAVEPVPSAQAAAPLPQVDSEARVTVLLVLEPGNRGIRRYERSADPVLCQGLVCYVSSGAAKSAIKLPRPVALGPGNTLGRRAFACRHSLVCVYRNLDIGEAGAAVQPVDLRILRHDRRETRRISADMSCGIDAGRLRCANTVRTPSWRAWIVPESLAEEAGERMLQEAIAAGLPDQRAAFRDVWGN